jgi:hypothetical protein
MEIKKVNLDREPISSAYIQQKQDFTSVVKMHKRYSDILWKKTFFYGGIGIASIATASIFLLSDFESNTTESKNIQSSTNTTATSAELPENTLTTEHLLATNQETKSPEEDVNPYSKIRKDEPSASTIISLDREFDENDNLEKTVISEVALSRNVLMPSISGKYNGSITNLELCDPNGIRAGKDVTIKKFKLQFASGNKDNEIEVTGNKIPDSVCEEISAAGFSQMIFITNIKADSEKGIIALPSMNFWVEIKV